MASKRTIPRSTWRLLLPYAGRRLPAILAVFALVTLVAFADSALLLLFQPLGDVLFPAAEGSFFDNGTLGGGAQWIGPLTERIEQGFADSGLALFDPGSALATVQAIVAIMVGLGLLGAFAVYAYLVLTSWLTVRLVVDLRLDLARHLMSLSLFYHGRRKLGDLLSRISADVQVTLNAIHVFFREVLRNAVEAVFFLGVALLAAPLLTVVILVLLPIIAIPVSLLAKKVRSRSTSSQTSLGASLQAVTQMFQGIRTVKAFRAEDRELASYEKINEEYVHHSVRMARAVALTQGWTTLFTTLGLAVLILAVGWGSARHGLFADPGTMFAFFFAQARMYSHVKRLTRALTALGESAGAADRLQALFAEQTDIVTPAEPVPLAGLGAGVRIENVTVVYPGTPTPALRGLDLDIQPGETVALVGASGSGKSTAMSLLCRFFDPTEGRVTVDGVDLRDVTLDDWTSLYSFVDQVPFLFHTSIGENIRYGKQDATDEEVREAARAAHIHDFIMSLPDGYETDVADAGSRLSGGQRQRITIARAVLKGAPLLLLDEATSNLDTESEVAIQDALDNLARRSTLIVIAHRLSTVRNADRIAVLEHGQLAEVGTHDQLLQLGGAYARLVRMQGLGETGAG